MIVGRAVLLLFLPNVALSMRAQLACRRNMRSMRHGCCTSTTTNTVQEIPLCLPSQLANASVLTCGDGDMSFSAALTQWGGCKSVVASTWDSEERLFRSFDKAANNVAVIHRSGGTVTYGVDATKLCESFAAPNSTFDTILWNFPHVPGKQNIKRNRELLQKFLKSCRELYMSSGRDGSINGHSTDGLVVKIALCGGQSGTRAGTMDEWNHSWQLTHQASEAGWVLTEVERFDAGVMAAFFPGYEVQGHRGHGGNFPLGTGSEMFTFRLPTAAAEAAVPSSAVPASAVAAVQVPMYIHEVHLLADRLCEDLSWLEGQARKAVVDLVDGSSSSGINSVWAVNLVDVYVCPRSSQISHTFQIAYGYQPAATDSSICGSSSGYGINSNTDLCGGGTEGERGGSLVGLGLAVGRTRADEFRVLVERELPLALGMAPRAVKHGGRVSLAYPWFVAQAVKALNTSETGTSTTEDKHIHQRHQQSSVSEQQESSQGGGVSDDSSSVGSVAVSIVEVADALRSMEDHDKHHNNHHNITEECDDDEEDNEIGDKANDVIDTNDDDSIGVDVVVGGARKTRSPEEEHIRAVARTLWRRRVRVLIRTAARASTTDIQ